MKCQMIFNVFGMKHLQALMLGFVYALDDVNMMVLGVLAREKRTDPPGTIPQERIWENENDLVQRWKWLATGAARGLIAILILRVNNKYILLALAVVEMVVLLIAHAMYIQKGLLPLQYTYLAVLLIQGTRWPLAMNIVAKWSTTSTITLMMWTFKASIDFFRAVYFHIVRSLRQHGILSMSIYMSVIVKGTFFVLWIIFGSGDPIQNIFVSKEELVELQEEHRLRLKCRWKNTGPFRQMLKTPIVYGCLVLHTAYMWIRSWNSDAFVAPFSRYRKSGYWLPLFLFYLQVILSGVVAYCTDLMVKKKTWPLNNIRKTCVAISAWGGGCCFMLAGAYLGNEVATTTFIVFYHIFQLVGGYYDVMCITYDVSPNYMGFTHCIMSCIAYLTMGFLPLVDKTLVGDGKDVTRVMSFLMYFYGSLLYFSCLVLLLSGTNSRRGYDTWDTVPWKEDSILSFP